MKTMLFVVLLGVASYVMLAVCPVVPIYAAQIILAGMSGFLMLLAIVLAYTAGEKGD